MQGSCGYGVLDKAKYPYWSVGALSTQNVFYLQGPVRGCGWDSSLAVLLAILSILRCVMFYMNTMMGERALTRQVNCCSCSSVC